MPLPIVQTVLENIADLIEARSTSEAAVLRGAELNKSFLANIRAKEGSDMQLGNLEKIARELSTPISALLLPRGKRLLMEDFLRTLDKFPQTRADDYAAEVETAARDAQSASEPGSDNPSRT